MYLMRKLVPVHRKYEYCVRSLSLKVGCTLGVFEILRLEGGLSRFHHKSPFSPLAVHGARG